MDDEQPTVWSQEDLDRMSGRKFTDDGKPIFRLTPVQYAIAADKLSELAKTADKLGCKPIALTVIGAENETYKDPNTALEKVVTYVLCTVSGDAPRINGWVFVARVEHHELGNVIAVAPNMDGMVDTSAYRATHQACDHCGQYRQRKDTYLVTARFPKNLVRDNTTTPPTWYDADGDEFTFDILQVGSSCLKDFLGHADPARIVRYIENLHKFMDELGSDDDDDLRFGGRANEPMFTTVSFLAHVAAMVRTHGWLPKGKAIEAGLPSTVERVWDNIDRIEHPNQSSRHYEPPVYPTAQDENEAKLAHEWLVTTVGSLPIDKRSDFQQNLYVAAGGPAFERRSAGFVACVIDQYHRAISAATERAKVKRTNEYFGEVGDRLKLVLTVTYVFEWSGNFGVTYKHIFLSSSGHTFTWSTSTMQLERGAKYVMTGTIKEHTEYKDTRQTVLTRCKVLERRDA